MKYIILIVCITFIFNLNSYSQEKTNYTKGYENGFREGYCYNRPVVSNCLYPIILYPPYPRINESIDNYTQGYNRGFQYGLDLKRANQASQNANINLENTTIEFNNYVNQLPVAAMVKVGMFKQKMYDTRKEWIQNRIDGLIQLINTLFVENNFPSSISDKCDFQSIRRSQVVWISDYAKTLAAVDFADNYRFSEIQSHFSKLENNNYSVYNNIASGEFLNQASPSQNSTSTKSSRKSTTYKSGVSGYTLNPYIPTQKQKRDAERKIKKIIRKSKR